MGWVASHPLAIILSFVLVSAALVYPFLLLQPTETASQEPEGLLFEARHLAADRFASSAHRMVFIVEARDGDLLRAEPLAELWENCRALREDPEIGPKLLRYPPPGPGEEIHGLRTIADLIDGQLRAAGQPVLDDAEEPAVRDAAARTLSMLSPEQLGLSQGTEEDPDDGRWRAPAMLLPVLLDNELLGGGGDHGSLGSGSVEKEELARRVLAHLRGAQRSLRVWGIATDVNLTSAEQGKAAGPFIGLTLFVALLLVGLLLRSYWSVAVVGLSLGMLMLWLRGLSNLMGLKQDQILATIVPIAMISFGVDFAFHAIGRYREASGAGHAPRTAFRIGLAGTLGALLLAMSTDAAAFLSNLSAGIESLAQFGVAAAAATVASFLLLGIFTPLVLMRIEEHRRAPRGPRTTGGALAEFIGGALASMGATAATLVMVFIQPALGVALLVAYGILFLLLPALLLPRPRLRSPGSGEPPLAPRPDGGQFHWLGALVSGLAGHRSYVLAVTVLFTAGAVSLALRVETRFDVRDFFSPSSDFVVGLGKFDEHIGNRSGEPALVYVEGPLADPRAVAALRAFALEIQALETDTIARDAAGVPQIEPGLLDVVDMISGGAPGTEPELLSAYQAALRDGLSGGGSRPDLSPDQVRTLLWVSDDGTRVATALRMRIPGSRSNENLAEVRAAMEPLVDRLRERLRPLDPTAMAVFTGRPVARHAALDAMRHAFRFSLLIAMGLCLLLATLFMRSLRFGLISIIPILLVVSWLHAFMYLAGYSINVVTATIGAISIGVGIDFSVHFIMRYREEIARGLRREAALYAAGAGTGGALLGAGFSSIAGFSILILAPMPMFSAYGVLTAVMIFMASVASLLVLPSLLSFATPE